MNLKLRLGMPLFKLLNMVNVYGFWTLDINWYNPELKYRFETEKMFNKDFSNTSCITTYCGLYLKEWISMKSGIS